MVKARRGLILSLFTLLVAIAVTTTSTYAWFVMNSSVTAQNMQVTVKSDSTYLVIEETASGENGKMGNIDSQTYSFSGVAARAVLPVKFKEMSGTTPTWQTAVGTSYNNGTKTGNYVDVAAGNVGRYVAGFNFVVGLNPNVSLNGNATDLRVSKVTLRTTSGDANGVFFDALSVLVVCGTATDNYVDAGGAATEGVVTGHGTQLAATVAADGTPVAVSVYLYINGDNANVKTANAVAANLGSYSVDVEFTVTPSA